MNPAGLIFGGQHDANFACNFACVHRSSACIQTGEVSSVVVTRIDQGCYDIVFVYGDYRGLDSGHINGTVVVGARSSRFVAFQQSHSSVDGVIYQGTNIFEDGHGLTAVNDVLDGSFFSILPSDQIAGDIAVSGKGIGDSASGTIVGSQDEDIALIVSGGSGQVGFGQVFGGVEVPVGGDLANDLSHFVTGQFRFARQGFSFAGVLDNKGAIRNFRLQNAPSAFKEDECVVVGSCASVEVERVARTAGIVYQVLGLLGTDSNAVEGDVVVDGVGVANKAVIGDDFYASSASSFGSSGSGRSVMRGDDDNLNTFGDQVFNIG